MDRCARNCCMRRRRRRSGGRSDRQRVRACGLRRAEARPNCRAWSVAQRVAQRTSYGFFPPGIEADAIVMGTPGSQVCTRPNHSEVCKESRVCRLMRQPKFAQGETSDLSAASSHRQPMRFLVLACFMTALTACGHHTGTDAGGACDPMDPACGTPGNPVIISCPGCSPFPPPGAGSPPMCTGQGATPQLVYPPDQVL